MLENTLHGEIGDVRSVAEGDSVGTPCGRYFTSVLSSPYEVAKLRESGRHLLAHLDCTSQPDFFLATLARNRWAPRIAVVKESGRVVGFVYLKERTFGRLGTGLLYGDATLPSMVIAEPQNQKIVFLNGVRALLQRPRVQGLRLFVPPDGYELPVLHELKAERSLDLQHGPAVPHSVMPLASTYEAFLGRLGARTRRSFRHLPQRSRAAKHQFLTNIRLEEYKSAAYKLLSDNVVGADRNGIQIALQMLAAARHPLLAALCSEQGDWLSIVSGWYESDRVVIFQQLNSDRQHPRDSLSLVMRARVVEMLIEQGYREVLWWGGVRGPLSYYVTQLPMLRVYLDKRNFGWRTFRRLLSSQRSRLPQKLAKEAGWIVPSPHDSGVNSSNADGESI